MITNSTNTLRNCDQRRELSTKISCLTILLSRHNTNEINCNFFMRLPNNTEEEVKKMT